MSRATELAICVVKRYCARLEHEKYPYWRSPEFNQLIYSKSAAYEILNMLKANRSEPPLILMEGFQEKMNEYACLNPKNSLMFSIAHDTAEDIINELLKAYYY